MSAQIAQRFATIDLRSNGSHRVSLVYNAASNPNPNPIPLLQHSLLPSLSPLVPCSRPASPIPLSRSAAPAPTLPRRFHRRPLSSAAAATSLACAPRRPRPPNPPPHPDAGRRARHVPPCCAAERARIRARRRTRAVTQPPPL
jgi:hypothetical protein